VIHTKDLEVHMVYVSDEKEDLAFVITELEKFIDYAGEPFVRIWYRWLNHEFVAQYGDQIFDVDEDPDYEWNYHPEPFVIQELPS
jgi:hypothetical protein